MFPRVHVVHPYPDSPAMARSVAALARAAVFTVSPEPDAGAALNYYMPWHGLVGLERAAYPGKHVGCYTHCNRGAEPLLLAACGRADRMVAVSWRGRQELLDLGIPSAHIRVIHKGHEGFTPGKIIVGVLGAEQPNGRKRSHLLLDLAWKMGPELSQWFAFSVVGMGWEQTVEQLRNCGVTVLYQQGLSEQDLAAWYRGLDLFLVTAYAEGGPLPLFEALASGVRVLSPRLGYAADLLPEADIYRGVNDLAGTLLEAVAPRRNRADLVSPYTWTQYAESTVLLWERLLGEPVERCGAVLRTRWRQLSDIIAQYRPRRFVEVGVYRGDRALHMLQDAAEYAAYSDLSYDGYDLFEHATSRHIVEGLSPEAPSLHTVMTRLAPTGARISLHPGDSRETLAKVAPEADLYLIDGGHGRDTLISDIRHVLAAAPPHAIVVLDDYWEGAGTAVGCQSLAPVVRELGWDWTVLPVTDHDEQRSIQLVLVTRGQPTCAHEVPIEALA